MKKRIPKGSAGSHASLEAVWQELDLARGDASARPKAATATALKQLERDLGKYRWRYAPPGTINLPPEIAASLAIHDGGIHVDGYDLLSTKQILNAAKYFARVPLLPRFGDQLVPFAVDSSGNYYAVDSKGRLIGVELQGPQRFFKKAKSISEWLTSVASRVKRGALVANKGGFFEPT